MTNPHSTVATSSETIPICIGTYSANCDGLRPLSSLLTEYTQSYTRDQLLPFMRDLITTLLAMSQAWLSCLLCQLSLHICDCIHVVMNRMQLPHLSLFLIVVYKVVFHRIPYTDQSMHCFLVIKYLHNSLWNQYILSRSLCSDY